MSIILKGINMPSRIDLDLHDNHIVLGGVLYPIDIDQLVYIPTPHGRLVDGDEMIKKYLLTEVMPYECMITAPTILEAEE